MNWNSTGDFFHMGGYGLYVWGSYAMAAALMLLEPLLARQRLRQALRDAVARTDHTDHTDHTESRP